MNFAVRQVVVLFVLGCLFLISGCRTIYAPPAPSQLSVKKARKAEMERAMSVAKRLPPEEQSENKETPKPSPPVKPKTSKPVKLADPAWASIQKQKASSEKVFTLTELIDMALQNNPLTRQSWENTRVALAVEKQAESAWYPQLTISETVSREKHLSNIPGGKINDWNYGPSAGLTFLLLDLGGRNANIESKFQKVIQAHSLYDQSLQDLIRDVQKAYYIYYSSLSAKEAAALDVQNTKTDYDIAQQRFDVGLGTKLDTLQAKSDYENSLYNLENAQGKVKSSRASLAKIIGVSAETNFGIVTPSQDLPTAINEDDISKLIEEAIQKRPDISALRADLESKKAAARAALSDLLPSLNLGMDAQQSKYSFYNTDVEKDYQRDYSGYLSVDWKIFDGLDNLNKKKQAEYEANMAWDALIQAELVASSDVWVKYYNFDTEVKKLKYSQTFFDTSLKSYDLALESYKAGLKSVSDLLQAQSNLSSARSRLIQSKQDVFIALAELAHSTGTPNIKIGVTKNSARIKGDDDGR